MRKTSKYIREMAVFAMLGAVMFTSKVLMEGLPNIHLVGVLTVAYTTVYRKRALIPLYIFVFMNGVFAGFSYWWVPYTYIWTILWGVTMLLPKKMPKKVGVVVYPLICGIHGLLFGILYAPAEALFFGLTFSETLAWIAAGFLSFDILHAIGNFALGLLIFPITEVLYRMSYKIGIVEKRDLKTDNTN